MRINNFGNFSRSKLELVAQKIRKEILKSVYSAGKGHIGGAFSIVEILVTLFHGGLIEKGNSENINKFLLSKGHAGVALYSVLADLKYFDYQELGFLNQGSLLGEHPDQHVPGVEFLSGSLGHGLSIANGIALANKLDEKEAKTFILMGDGECYEGSVWEGAMFAAHHQLRNLCAIIDRNNLITHGGTEKFNKLEPFKEKWASFGWSVIVVDGHSFENLIRAFKTFFENDSNKPFIVIADTVKGKGVSFMENQHKWHHGGIDKELYAKALDELSQRKNGK